MMFLLALIGECYIQQKHKFYGEDIRTKVDMCVAQKFTVANVQDGGSCNTHPRKRLR